MDHLWEKNNRKIVRLIQLSKLSNGCRSRFERGLTLINWEPPWGGVGLARTRFEPPRIKTSAERSSSVHICMHKSARAHVRGPSDAPLGGRRHCIKRCCINMHITSINKVGANNPTDHRALHSLFLWRLYSSPLILPS